MQRKLLEIIIVDFNATRQLLIIYSAFVKYLRKMGINKAGHKLFIDYRDNLADRGVDGRIILTLRRLMLYIYGAPILDVSRSHTTTQHSR